MTTALNERALLAHLRVSSWSGVKTDAAVTAETIKSQKAETGAGSFSKKLLPTWMLLEFNSVTNEAREYHKRVTLPWLDGGHRVLPTTLYFEYVQKMSNFKTDVEAAVKKFLDDRYDLMIDTARTRLGDMFHLEDFPTKDDLRVRFGIDIGFLPMPTAADWRVDLTDAQRTALAAEVEADMEQRQSDAMRDVWKRLYDCVDHMATVLGDPDKRFQNSMLEKARELTELLPKLNIADDPDLNQCVDEVREKLCEAKPEALREIPEKRATAADDAKAILDRMRARFAPPQAAESVRSS